MTLPEIEAFLTVAETGTISEAARTLFISQPALTRRLQLLEQELGCPLFERQKGHRNVKLTEQGRQFAHIAEKWRRLWAETDSIRTAQRRESLSLAAVDSVSHNMLSSVMVDFTKKGYLLQIYNAFSETAYRYMEQEIFELAFITLQDYTRP